MQAQVLDAKDAWVPTTCYGCYNQCGILVHRVNNVITEIRGDPNHTASAGKVCAKGLARVMDLQDPNRVLKPLKRTNPEKGIGVDPKWQEITWKEALDTVTEKLATLHRDDPRKLLLASFDIAGGVVERAWATAFGTPNAGSWSASTFCGHGEHPAIMMNTGVINLEIDFDRCKFAMEWGVQKGALIDSNANNVSGRVAAARRRGMKLVVVDPVLSPIAAKADEWVPIRPGTDSALALGMLNVLLNDLGVYDAPFLKSRTNAPYLTVADGRYVRDKATGKPLVWDLATGRATRYDDPNLQDPALEGSYQVDGAPCRPAFQRLKEHVKRYPAEKVAEITTIPAETVRRLAREFGEAASIGSTITIEGKTLPYRPVGVDFKKGVSGHVHSLPAGFTLMMLVTVVGAVDVPGGTLGHRLGPWEVPQEAGPDGLMLRGGSGMRAPVYPADIARAPESPDLRELYPVRLHTTSNMVITLPDPERFKLPYRPEMMIQARHNLMMSTFNPQAMAKTLKTLDFIVSFAIKIDETAEFADIVLPDAHDFERTDPFPGTFPGYVPGLVDWCWSQRQAVVPAPPGVRAWREVLMDLAERLGFLSEFNEIGNTLFRLDDAHRLDPKVKYSMAELAERQIKSIAGPQYGLHSFTQSSAIRAKRTVEDAYPGAFQKAKMPVYYEYLIDAGRQVGAVTQELGIPWDTSDYQPLPDWRPCPSYEEDPKDGYDLIAVNFKVPFQTFSITADNPIISEVSELHPYAYKILIGRQAAQERKIRDGDLITVESRAGKVQGRAKVTEGIHPQVVGIPGTFGHWAKGLPIAQGKGVHFNALVPADLSRIGPLAGSNDFCVGVKVYKAQGGKA
ncbi:MAG: molybdopterin-dependent oxidoreductase [Chloroflexi bacterium]|nr:molybdopterin-dependent oxidoreductase [Chloroflexota bacterium]